LVVNHHDCMVWLKYTNQMFLFIQYYQCQVQVAEWLSVVEECHINSSTKFIADSLHDIKLRMMRNLLASMLRLCILTYRCMKPLKSTYKPTILWEIQKTTVDEETFKELLKVCSCDVTMLKNDGYYKQIDGLAMGNPLAPFLANGWMYKFILL